MLEVSSSDDLSVKSVGIFATRMSIEKARKELNYEPATRFEEGIGKFVAWLKAVR